MTQAAVEERFARARLSRATEPGDPDLARLLDSYSAVDLVQRIAAGDPTLELGVKGPVWADRLARTDGAGVLDTGNRCGARFVIPGDAEWPVELSDLGVLGSAPERLAGVPAGLWLRGPLVLADTAATAVAIVGARAATSYGEYVAENLAAGCAARERAVVSGGAYGIDAAAHRGALSADGPTVAVLASGIDRFYPAGQAGQLAEIAERGLLVSEAAPGCAPSRSRFLVRNRLIAALSRGTVVVEAAWRSGSLNTARWARDIGRPVMGVPGPVTSMLSAGVHELLRQPETVLVTDAAEVLELVAPIGAEFAPTRQGELRPGDRLGPEARRVLDAVPAVLAAPAASIAAIAERSVADTLATLSALTAEGLVVRVGAKWRRTPASPDAP